MIEAGRITQANRVRCCEHAEPAIWTDDAVLIEERHLPVCFQYALDNEHHIGTARIIFVKDQRDRMLKRPGKKAFLELRYRSEEHTSELQSLMRISYAVFCLKKKKKKQKTKAYPIQSTQHNYKETD